MTLIVIVNRYCNMFIFLKVNAMFEPCCEISVPVTMACSKGSYKQRHIHSLASLSRDVNHSNFCGIIPLIKANFHISISDVKIPANKDFNTVTDKVKGVTPTSTPMWRKTIPVSIIIPYHQ